MDQFRFVENFTAKKQDMTENYNKIAEKMSCMWFSSIQHSSDHSGTYNVSIKLKAIYVIQIILFN